MKIQSRSLTLILAFLFSLSTSFAQSVEEGKKLFDANCTACHAVHKEVVGPPLKDVHKRRDEAWLIKWVKNSQAVVKSGDAYANAIFKKYNGQVMQAFGSLKDGEVKSLLAYIKEESGKAPEPVPGATASTGSGSKEGSDGSSFFTPTTLVVGIGILLMLLLIWFMLGRVKHLLEEKIYVQKPELRPENYEFKFFRDTFWPWFRGLNKTVAAILGLMIFTILFAIPSSFNYANTEVGVQKGYSPSQPINFSHKIHAGDFKIDCKYCHYSVEKSKQASIPSASTCMNCHSYVQAKEKYNGKISPEINKIYTAVGFNPETKKYDGPQKPIKWVRIHNLPDHAVFNHSTHVKVGKVACQKCHGEVQEMEKVYQRNSLQMGWCIACHKESNIDLANNAYYSKLHERMKKEGKTEVKVAENGGLECSKCHY